MEYKIENGIPLPPRERDGRWTEIAKRMTAGDSVLLPDAKQANSLRGALVNQGMRVSQRTTPNGVRVWAVGLKDDG